MHYTTRIGLCAAGLISLTCLAPVHGANHLWEVSELFSDASGSVQFIELHNDSDFEGFMTGTTLTATNSDMSEVRTFTFPSDLPNPLATANRYLLVATTDFSSLSGSVVPDYMLPSNFLFTDGGRLTFSASNDSITYDALPTDGVQSLTRDLTTNMVAPATNSPTNFAGDTGSVVVPEPGGIIASLAFGGLLLVRRQRRAG